mmetsp:Transcript_53011/g.119407  ORF Transcript_53011/g.119407 Transcript_53011/m.119407 type:complete len:203 (+) Transcript_53011:544-1152(+)
MSSGSPRTSSGSGCPAALPMSGNLKRMFPGCISPWRNLSFKAICTNALMANCPTFSRISLSASQAWPPTPAFASCSSRTLCRGVACSKDSTSTDSATYGRTTSGKRTRRPLPVVPYSKFLLKVSRLEASIRRSACGRTNASKCPTASDMPRHRPAGHSFSKVRARSHMTSRSSSSLACALGWHTFTATSRSGCSESTTSQPW